MMEDPKQHVQRKIRQLVFLHVQHVNSQYGKIPIDQNKEYQRIYADWQAGLITFKCGTNKSEQPQHHLGV